jgi:hypothetical protein
VSRQIPLALGDCKSLVQSYLQHTRPVGPAELTEAINYGYGKAIKAILAVRPQSFLSVIRPFTFVSGVTEYDVGNYDPPFWRPFKLKVVGGNVTRSIRFKYRPLIDADFEEKEESTSGAFSEIAYDVLFGMMAATTPSAIFMGGTIGSNTILVDSSAGFTQGMLIRILGAGDLQTVGGSTQLAGTYYGVVIGPFGPGALAISPPLGFIPGTGIPITVMTRQTLKIAPALRETISGELWFQYRPARLQNDNDLLEPIISDHVDMVVHYAMAMLKRAVGDTDSRDYFEDGQSQRAELAQDLDPMSHQNSEGVGSDLWGD